MVERWGEEQARNISRALSGREKRECGSGVRQNLNPFNGDKSPSARDPPRRAGRQFVRVYPTYLDISTSRPGVARVANHLPTSFSPPLLILSSRFLTCVPSFLSLTSFSLPLFSSFLLFSYLSPFFFVFLSLLFVVPTLLIFLLFLSLSFLIFFLAFFLSTWFYSFLFLRKFDSISLITPLTGKIIKLTSSIHHGV